MLHHATVSDCFSDFVSSSFILCKNGFKTISHMRSAVIAIFIFVWFVAESQTIKPGWPQTSHQAKPWTRWWWHGSAVTKEGITAELETFKKAGLGGVEITPIYGVFGKEDMFINYLSPQWMEMLEHTLKEAERLDLGVDMATGTGWPFGGPWVSSEDACKNVVHKIYEVKAGESLKELVLCEQEPFLRSVGTQIYETQGIYKIPGQEPASTKQEPLTRSDARQLKIEDLVEPVSANTNLQALALDQVRFKKMLPLVVLMGYSDAGDVVNLTEKVDARGKLNWIAPKGNWKLYALFQGWHGKMVERAAPGGEGNVLDHFSGNAIEKYLAYFDNTFAGHKINLLRAFFNDSYEVDDAKGAADWTPTLLEEFHKRRGYDLRLHVPALLGHDTAERNERIVSDYRQTIGEMLHDNFTSKWKSWAAKHGALVRNQAHGSPANILDLYALVDIPEIEGTDPLRIKMASSAGNVTGKQLVSSESATWLNDHFESNWHNVKEALDRFMLNGVNHVFYHGTAYSPANEPWPGWLFYAAAHFNDRNPLWDHFGALNAYIERCQSFLQNTKSDNDILLYYPVYDRFAVRGAKTLEHFDGIGRQFEGSSFEKTAQALLKNHYAFDFISDKQIQNSSVDGGEIVTEGISRYKAIIIPSCRFMPVTTLTKIYDMARAGAKIVFMEDLPRSFPGFSNYTQSLKEFQIFCKSIQSLSSRDKNVKIFNASEPGQALVTAAIQHEQIPESLGYIRKRQADGTRVYFINNSSSEYFDSWVTLQTTGKSVMIYDPMTGEFGKAKVKWSSEGKTTVYLQLESRQTVILQFFNSDVSAPGYFYSEQGSAVTLDGEWQLEFISGGPTFPGPQKLKQLGSWTTLGDAYANFSGRGAYRIDFRRPSETGEKYLLDLGKVHETALVILNGKVLGHLIGPVYKLTIDPALLAENNTLEIQVANLMANRVAYMDRNNIFWKKFYNVNFPALKAENRTNGLFDASQWRPRDSGLLGPVKITALKSKKIF